MSSICGTISTNGQFQVVKDGDFTECFEDFVLFGAVNVLFVLAAALRYVQLTDYPLVKVPASRVHMVKMITCLVLTLLPAIYLMSLLLSETAQPYQIVYGTLAVSSWSLCVLVLGREFARALPHNWVLRSFWIASFVVSCVKLRTSVHTFRTNASDPAKFYVFLFTFLGCAVMAVMALLFRKSHDALDRYSVLPARNAAGEGRTFAAIAELFELAKPEKPLLILAGCASVASALLFLAQPFIIGEIIDDVVAKSSGAGQRGKLNSFAGLLLLLFACDALFHGARAALFGMAAERFAARQRAALFEVLMKQNTEFFEDDGSAGVLDVLETDVATVKQALTDSVGSTLTQVTNVVVGISLLFALSWKLTVVMFAMAPLAILAQVAANRIGTRRERMAEAALDGAADVAEQTISNIKTVRTCGREQREASRYTDELFAAFRLAKRSVAIRGALDSTALFAMNACIVMGLWYGGLLVLRGPRELSGGRLTAYILYTLYAVFGITQLTVFRQKLAGALSCGSRLLSLLNRRPDNDSFGGFQASEIKGLVEFQNVCYTPLKSATAPNLQGLSFTCHPKTLTVVVGPSRGGKSCIPSLLARLYDVNTGRVAVDMKDLAAYDMKWLRQQMSFVSPDAAIFSTSVTKNISYSCESVNVSEVVEAARSAGAHEFISALPDGYQTVLNRPTPEGGAVILTAAQRQLIAISRAFLKRAPILVVEEAGDSNGDEEGNVFDRLDRLMPGRTVICITNRLDRIKTADQIVVVRGGIATQVGSFTELADQAGYFRDFVNRAVAGHADDAAEASGALNIPLQACFSNMERHCNADEEAQSLLQSLRNRLGAKPNVVDSSQSQPSGGIEPFDGVMGSSSAVQQRQSTVHAVSQDNSLLDF